MALAPPSEGTSKGLGIENIFRCQAQEAANRALWM